MAQRISQIPSEAIPYAQEALPMASLKRGLGGMTLPNAGMVNSMDGGAFSKPGANAQVQRNSELAMQNFNQNAISARPQAQAQGAGQVRKQLVDMSTAQSQEQQHLNQFMANEMEKRGMGQDIMRLNSIMESPERAKFENDIAVSSAMHQQGRAPELGQMIAEANRYG
jgi:hypothetical protein